MREGVCVCIETSTRVISDRDRPDSSRGGRGGGARRASRPTDEPRDALTRDLDLPRGPRRERVRRGNWEGDLRGSEVRVLATAGAFRVVPMDELRRPDDRTHVHRKDVERLRGDGPRPHDALHRRT